METRMLYVVIGFLVILGIVFLFLGKIRARINDYKFNIAALRDAISVEEYSMRYTCSKSGTTAKYHISIPYLKIKNNGNKMASVVILFKIGDEIKLGSGDCSTKIDINPRGELELSSCLDEDFESYKDCPGTSDFVDTLDVVIFEPSSITKCPAIKKNSYAYLLQKCGEGYINDISLDIENGDYLPVD